MTDEQQRRAQLAKDLLEDVKFALKLDSDRALAHRLGITPGYISKLRNGNLAITAKMIVRLHEETGMSIAMLKRYLPDGKLSD